MLLSPTKQEDAMLKELKKDWEKYCSLLSVTPEDCKVQLFAEFLFNPAKLRERYNSEQIFQHRLATGWVV